MSKQLMRQSLDTGILQPLPSPGIQFVTRSLHRYGRQVALATSFAAACVQYANQPCSSTTKNSSTPNLHSTFQSIAKNNRSTQLRQALTTSTARQLAPPSSRRLAARAFCTSTPLRDATHVSQPSDDLTPFKKESINATQTDGDQARELSDINDIGELMRHPALLKNIKKPRYPIILCHGLYGFDVRGPFWGLEIHYWASVLDILREKVGAEVIVRGVPGTGAIADRAQKLHKFLASDEAGVRGKPLNFVAHSMGGLDARHIISIIKPLPEEYKPLSLTTICTPHKGSPFMDWCNANVGTGNDRVQEEISKARQKLAQGDLTTQELQEATRAAELEERKKLPFSLKTPLFVRPSKAQQEEEERKGKKNKEGGVVDTVKSTLTNVAATATSFTPTPIVSADESSPSMVSAALPKEDNNDNKKKEKSSSLLNFGSFNKALSSIGGLFSSYMLGVLDQPAYAMLSTRYMSQVFNPSVPNSPDVAYFSIASRKRSLPIWHPLWLPKVILDAAAESRSAGGETDGSADALGGNLQGNDGLVSVESAKWGTFLGVIEGCDHWDLRGGGAPRWRGRMNPATNKPWPEDKDGNKEEEVKEKNKNKGWMDINTIVGKLLNRKEEAAALAVKVENKSNNGKEEKTFTPVKSKDNNTEEDKDQGLLDEVAGWISDRLPQGDEARRAQAEKVAEEQDRTFQQPNKDEVITKRGQEKDSSREDEKDFKMEKEQGITFDASTTSVKLRREAAWQEQLGHNDAARELRRELAWHRTNWDRQSDSTKSDQNMVKLLRNSDWGERPSKQKSDSKEVKKLEDVNELERFWIALCRHLWNRGY